MILILLILLLIVINVVNIIIVVIVNYFSRLLQRQVEKSLQEFFRTHQDAWQQSHVKRFSEDQIELLDMYKGRPVYFG